MSEQKHLILINGCKRSGKDTAAWMIAEYYRSVDIFKAATPLYDAIPQLFRIDNVVDWPDMYDLYKEEPSDQLCGMSPRQAMIWLSEEVVKPKFGEDFFGRRLAEEIKRFHSDQLAVISDSGYACEMSTTISSLPDYTHHLIRIVREGTSFQGDSRSHITPEEIGVPQENYTIIHNDGSLEELEQTIRTWVDTNIGEPK